VRGRSKIWEVVGEIWFAAVKDGCYMGCIHLYPGMWDRLLLFG